MAYSEDWYCFATITIDNTMVEAAMAQFAVYLAEDNLPDMMLDADGPFPSKSAGEDIRFSSDSDGASPLAFHIVEYTQNNNPALASANIWVRTPVSDVADTVIYVWWRNAAASALPAADTYGQYNTWKSIPNNLYARWMCDDGEDSTSYDIDFVETDVSFVAGIIDDCAEFDADEAATFTWLTGRTQLRWTGWVYVDSAGQDGDVIFEFNPFSLEIGYSGIGYRLIFRSYHGTQGVWRQDTVLDFDTWWHIAISYDGGDVANDPIIATNGSQLAQTELVTPVGVLGGGSATGYLARKSTGSELTGKLDEMYLLWEKAVDAAALVDRAHTQFHNQNAPFTFCAASAGQIVKRGMLRV